MSFHLSETANVQSGTSIKGKAAVGLEFPEEKPEFSSQVTIGALDPGH